MVDCILIEQLDLSARIGVPEVERALPQRLAVSLRLEIPGGFAGLDDDLRRTVDYVAVCEAVRAVTAERPRRLIETLGEDIAAAVLRGFAVAAVEVELRKFVLPQTEYVAVRLRRERAAPAEK